MRELPPAVPERSRGGEAVTAAEKAFRRASVTAQCCETDVGSLPQCALVSGASTWMNVAFDWDGDSERARGHNHRIAESILLDGFSVEELTAVGG